MPVMSTLPEHFVTEFSTNWEFELQQRESKLKSYVHVDPIKGKEKWYNNLHKTKMRKITQRGGQTIVQDQTSDKRWLRESAFDDVARFDEFDDDLLGSIALPDGETIQNQAAAYNRTCDETIIEAAQGAAYTGETGVTPVSLPGSQQIAVNFVPTGTPANSGLTLAKLIKAKSILGMNEVDDSETLVFAYTQRQLDDLLYNVDKISSSDYANVKALVEGKVDYFMGFKFVKIELLPKVSTTRSCFAWAKSGITFSPGEKKVHMDILPTHNHALQIRTVARMGAVRRDEKKVVEIFCSEA